MGPNRQGRKPRKGGAVDKRDKKKRDKTRKERDDRDKKAKAMDNERKGKGKGRPTKEKYKAKLFEALEKKKNLYRKDLPRLVLDKATVSRLKYILDNYRQAKTRFMGVDLDGDDDDADSVDLENIDVENMDQDELAKLLGLTDHDFDSSDSDSSDSDSSSDDSDESEQDSDSGSSIDSDIANDFMQNLDHEDKLKEHLFVDEDDVPEPPMSNLESTLMSSVETSVSFHDLTWLQNIGFPQARAVEALRGRTLLESLVYLYNSATISKETALSFQSGKESLSLFGVSSEEMLETRQEEEMVLQAMFGPDFDSTTEPNAWILHLDAAIPSEYLSKGTKPKARHILEIYFGQESVYPYEPPVIVFRDETDRLASRYALAICAALHEKAKLWTGQPMVYSLVSWLQGSELEEFLSCPPPAYLKLAQEEMRAGSRQTSAVPSKTQLKKALTSGPLPRYNQLYYGVGVAITLKVDQGTGRTVNGFIQEVLTAGDHPRGVKVRLRDSRVGRVQFLTGLSFEAGAQTTKSSSSGLPSGFKNLSINEKSTPFASPKAISQKSKASASKNASFITGMGQVTQRSRSPSPVRVKNPTDSVKTKTFMPNMSKETLDRQSHEIQNAFIKHQQTEKYIKMKAQREGLPSFQLQDEIIKTIANNRVVIVSGETGCGKSTQVPQFILDDAIRSGNGARCKILVTQPRRISALGLSDRVSSERAEPVGDSVGYHIRLENRMSAKTRILFCTTGILLRRMEEGPEGESVDGGIDDVSHIIVDEVHERSLDSDFLLMVLKDLLKVRVDLKVILMSATLNAELFASYFDGAPLVHIPGRTFPVTALYLEDVLARTAYKPTVEFCRKGGHGKGKQVMDDYSKSPRGFKPDASNRKGYKASDSKFEESPSKGKKFQKNRFAVETESSDDDFFPTSDSEKVRDEDLNVSALMKRYPKLKEPAASALSMMDTDKIQYPLVEIIVVEIVSKLLGKKSARSVPGAKPSQTANTPKTKRKPGKPANPGPEEAEPDSDEQAPNRGVLIFMPGFAEIATLHELLLQNTVVRQGTNNGKLCMALHSTLSSEEQMRVFNRPPDGSVKIVIATNVAETSITIDDVVFVIDCGKMKQTQFDPMKGMASLEECWVSRANATQRCGRAGRVQSGTCIHLFTSHKFTHHMIEQQPPEIHRTPLEQICLRIKILPFLKSPIAQVLQQVVEPPSPEAVQAAINTLCTLRALAKDETLTPLGFHLGRLPVDVRIGKLILFGSIFGCLDSVLTIASAMSVKSPFVAPFEKRFMADVKKQEFATGVSDHLTLLTAYNTWLVARRDGFPAERAFLYDNFLSGKTLNMIASVKRQLTELLSDIGFIKTRVRAKDMERKGGRNSDGVADAIGEAGMRADHSELIKAVLVSALYPNVIKIENPPPKGGGMKGKGPSAQDLKLWVQNDEAVFIHPTSVNHKVGKYPTKFLVYHEKVKTSKVYIRDCSSVSPFALAFFGGRLIWDRQRNLLKLDEGWIQFAAGEKEAAVIEATRTAFDELLQMKIENPELDVSTTDLVREIISLVTRNGGN